MCMVNECTAKSFDLRWTRLSFGMNRSSRGTRAQCRSDLKCDKPSVESPGYPEFVNVSDEEAGNRYDHRSLSNCVRAERSLTPFCRRGFNCATGSSINKVEKIRIWCQVPVLAACAQGHCQVSHKQFFLAPSTCDTAWFWDWCCSFQTLKMLTSFSNIARGLRFGQCPYQTLTEQTEWARATRSSA